MANVQWGHVLAAAVGGYLKGKQISQGMDEAEEEKKAKAEDRAYMQAQRQRTTKQQGVEDQLQTNLQDAARPVTITEGAGGMVRPATMDNSDVGLPENAALPNGGLLPASYRVADQTFTDRPQAEEAAAKHNAPEAIQGRQILALQQGAKPMQALQMQQSMVQTQAAQNQLAQAQAADKREKMFRDVTTQFAKSGWSGIPKIYENYNDGNSAQVQEDGKGGATVLQIGPDGKEIGRQSFATPMDFISGQIAGLDPKLWSGIQQHKAESDAARSFKRDEGERDRELKREHNAELLKAAAQSGGNGKPPPGYRWTAGGDQEAVPGGPADVKKQGTMNADSAALTGSMSGFDRLAVAANDVLNHPGLNGITGWRGKIPNAPGSDAANAEALLGTLKSQVGFGVLQDMRNNSKTGGALGSVSDQEGKRLEANLAALDRAQSPEQFKVQLQKIIQYTDQAKDRLRQSFNIRHPSEGGADGVGGVSTSAPGKGKSAPAPAALSDIEAELRSRGLSK